ncbi:MAG: glutathione peroxidase [Bacteroidota bacterium]
MTLRQKFLQFVYPIWMLLAKLIGKAKPVQTNTLNVEPIQSFYDLQALKNNKTLFPFSSLKNKKVLIVNTASDCGYTNQYAELEKLYQLHKDKLMVLGFPANDFKEEEKGSDEEIAVFCKVNFGVSFPIMQKSVVVRKNDRHEVYKWLTDPNKNGWNKQSPTWNFAKYLIDEYGVLTHYFEPSVSPLSDEVKDPVGK